MMGISIQTLTPPVVAGRLMGLVTFIFCSVASCVKWTHTAIFKELWELVTIYSPYSAW